MNFFPFQMAEGKRRSSCSAALSFPFPFPFSLYLTGRRDEDGGDLSRS